MGRQEVRRYKQDAWLRPQFLLACTNEHGAIRELDRNGKPLRRWNADDKGRPMEGGINDIMVTANDGAYATVFGNWTGAGVPTEILGKVLYKAPGADAWVEV